VRRTNINGMQLCSLALDVAPLTVKIASMFLKEDKICYKWYVTLYILDQSIVRIEFT